MQTRALRRQGHAQLRPAMRALTPHLSNFASAFTSVILSSQTMISLVMVSILQCVSKGSQSRVGFAFPDDAHRQVRGKVESTLEDMGALKLSRISPSRCGLGACASAQALRRQQECRPRLRSPSCCPTSLPSPFCRSRTCQAIRAGILCRRYRRRHHHRAVALQVAVRDRAQFELHLQGPSGRYQGSRAQARSCAMS